MINGGWKSYENMVSNPTLGEHPKDLVVNPNTDRIYIHERGSGKIYVINGKTNQKISEFNIGMCPQFLFGSGMAVDFSRNRIYVGSCAFIGIYVIDGDTNNIVANITLNNAPKNIFVDQFTHRIYIIKDFSPILNIIDGQTNTVIPYYGFLRYALFRPTF